LNVNILVIHSLMRFPMRVETCTKSVETCTKSVEQRVSSHVALCCTLLLCVHARMHTCVRPQRGARWDEGRGGVQGRERGEGRSEGRSGPAIDTRPTSTRTTTYFYSCSSAYSCLLPTPVCVVNPSLSLSLSFPSSLARAHELSLWLSLALSPPPSIPRFPSL
jgi:hypothetical protein